MDQLALLFVIVFCLWAVVDPRIPSGILTTVGLLAVMIGCLAALDDSAYILRAFSVRTWGLVLVGWGQFWRVAGRSIWLQCANRWRTVHSVAKFFGVDRRQRRRS